MCIGGGPMPGRPGWGTPAAAAGRCQRPGWRVGGPRCARCLTCWCIPSRRVELAARGGAVARGPAAPHCDGAAMGAAHRTQAPATGGGAGGGGGGAELRACACGALLQLDFHSQSSPPPPPASASPIAEAPSPPASAAITSAPNRRPSPRLRGGQRRGWRPPARSRWGAPSSCSSVTATGCRERCLRTTSEPTAWCCGTPAGQGPRGLSCGCCGATRCARGAGKGGGGAGAAARRAAAAGDTDH